jgi:hypothetical protein
MKNIIKNWKTTVALGYITAEVGGQITSVCIALGLIAGKDGNKTGVAN